MKKIYSLLLTAAALLVGTNAWAQHTISLEYYGGAKADQTFATLQEAIDYVNPGDSATITLSANQTLNEGILIPHVTSVATDADKIVNRAGQRICIDLGGKTIKMTSGVNHTLFSLIKGTLRFTGKGTIKREADRNGGNVFQRCAIAVTGADANKNDATKDRSKQVWSTLYVDKDVTVIGHGDDCFGIGINEIESESVYPRFAGYQTSFLGYTTKQSHGTGNMWDPTTSGAQYSAFGVRVFINGTVDGTVRGVNVCGNINQTPGIVEGINARKYPTYPFYDHYFPYVKICKDADVYCEPSGITDNGNGGIYLGGWAVVDIEGTVHGQTGIMVKAGDVLIQDGTVYSDCPSASFTGNYHGTVEGSGIFVASSASYAGESSVTVAGDSYIAGNGGCAIVDICATSTSEQTSTAVTHIDITGGTIVAGETGAISLGTNTSNVTDITGGVVEGKVDIGDASDESQRFHTDVTTLLPNTTEYHTTVIADDAGNQTVVVSQGAAPVAGNWVSKIDDTHPQIEGASVKWQVNSSDEIASNLRLTELEINDTLANGDPRDQVLTIKSGATLEVGRVIMGSKAKIIVEAGAKLLVTGTQGIVAPVAENIELRSSESAQAIFLFHPDVTSNRHPNATVNLTSKGYCKNGDENQKVWQRFGVPAYTAKEEEGAVIRYSTDPTKNPVTYNDPGWILAFDYSVDDWYTMPADDAFVPFQCYAAASTATVANHTVYTFKCPLMGNTDFTLPLNAYTDWNYYANSYMAPIDIRQMLTTFVNSNANVRGTVYVYRSEDDWWDNVNLGQLGYFPTAAQTKIAPMQAFIFQKREEGTADAVISYKNHIYNPDPTTTPVAAPAREHEVFSAAIIEIAAADGAKDKLYLIESDKFSADFDNGYDAAKYMNNESFNLFAGEQLGMIATDNLEGTAISMTTKVQTSFTMTFSNVTNMEYAVRDMLTGTETAIVEGATYMFSMAANANAEGRFQIVPVAKMPTAIENIEETAAVKGIYTITGQYVGNDYHSLQNGVYVVDGKKIVK